LPSDDLHLTKWLLLAGRYSGGPEIACVMLRKPFQPHTQVLPLHHKYFESVARVTERILFPTGHLPGPSQTSKCSVVQKFFSSGKIA